MTAQEPAPHLRVTAISKQFGGVRALTDVSLEVQRGTVHAIVGENGAGKSTLNSIISGVQQPDDGFIEVAGEAVVFKAPFAAHRKGITIIEQELALLPQHTVLQNVFFGLETTRAGFVSDRGLLKRFQQLMVRTKFDLDPDAVVGELSVARQQLVEITRALARNAELLIMDEPTAALSREESDQLLNVVRNLRAAGTTVIYVSHILPDVLAIADTITVMRTGRVVETAPASSFTEKRLVTSMVGGEVDTTFPDRNPPPAGNEPVLTVENLTVRGLVEDATLNVRPGEVVGIAGLIGSERSELLHAIFGALPKESGVIKVSGAETNFGSPLDAISAGMGLLPESRKEQGLFMAQTLQTNLSFARIRDVARTGFIDHKNEARRARQLLSELNVQPPNLRATVQQLSGGNQQKVSLGKWLFVAPRILLIDEPTRGVDPRSRRAIYEIVAELAEQGVAILLVSSDIDEVIGLSDRVFVMRGGRVVKEFPGGTGRQQLMSAAFGTDPDDPHSAIPTEALV